MLCHEFVEWVFLHVGVRALLTAQHTVQLVSGCFVLGMNLVLSEGDQDAATPGIERSL